MKGVRFRDHEDAGGILERARHYRDQGADELVFYDITASPDGRTADSEWVSRVAEVLDIPFCVAGGIRSVAAAEAVLNSGADKVSINSPALENAELIGELAARFGSQCVVVGIDSRAIDGELVVLQYAGDPDRTIHTPRRTLEWVEEVQARGAGEIVLNCVNHDGTRDGYDIEQLRTVRERCSVPLVASGGAGTREHFRDVFHETSVDAALAASVFHRGTIDIPDLKRYLAACEIPIRT